MGLKYETIVITRPAHQAEPLTKLIEKLGAKTIIFPTLEILPTPDKNDLVAAIKQISKYQIAIFVSANAVNYSLADFDQPFPSIPVIAIGPGTARALQAKGIESTLPQSPSSEAILALPVLQNIHAQKIAIFCGEQTRSLLKTDLTTRGAIVDEIVCYRRRCPVADSKAALKLWQAKQVSLIISTSSESLANLWQLFAKMASEWLLSTPLLVINPAMAAQAKQYGFQSVIIAANASDQAIGDAIKREKYA